MKFRYEEQALYKNDICTLFSSNEKNHRLDLGCPLCREKYAANNILAVHFANFQKVQELIGEARKYIGVETIYSRVVEYEEIIEEIEENE